MLTVIAGEDSVASRLKLQTLKKTFVEKGFSITNTSLDNIKEVLKDSSGVRDLFGKQSIYFVEGIASKYKGHTKSEFKDAVQKLAREKEIHIIDWENGKSAYELASLKRIASTFDEYKPGKNIFQLLDECYPGNLKIFVDTLHVVSESKEIIFIYTLIWKHIRKLIQAKKDTLDPSIPSWQRQKLTYQANKWNEDSLVNFYERLMRIDSSLKTNQTSYSLEESLELLVCYYLK